ncbi:MAG: hypothetical protein JWM71_1075 [Solirubrobacteraceae bacterium]|nr:hypothetical protein [Solirubrobacteraceae bacterium]
MSFADGWWPHPADATWTYAWGDSAYAPSSTLEQVTVKSGADAKAFALGWTTQDLGNPPEAIASQGAVSFNQTASGLQVSDWASTAAAATFPVLCAQLANCGNSLSGALYLVIWGNRSPLLAEPVVDGQTWSSTGGVDGDVTSTSSLVDVEKVQVPAFPDGVEAAKVRSEISQAGALGDPYGSGVRTTWWVYGVGPVKVQFQHAGGSDASTSEAVLQSTSLAPAAAPSSTNYLPITKGDTHRFSWTNSKHLAKPSVQDVATDATVNGSGRFVDSSVSGPIKVAASYGFTDRLDGVTNIWGQMQAATLAKFPRLGPAALPADQRRHFFTPMDLMTYGLNPILPAYPSVGNSWASKNPSRDFSVYGVNGTARITGTAQVKVPAGTFETLVVTSKLRQPGFPFGSGIRTSYFAAGIGLVKLVFRHDDHSTSIVELIKH